MRKLYASLPAIAMLLFCTACDKKHCWYCTQQLTMADTAFGNQRTVWKDTTLCDISEGQKTDYVIDGVYTRYMTVQDTVWEMRSLTDCKKR